MLATQQGRPPQRSVSPDRRTRIERSSIDGGDALLAERKCQQTGTQQHKARRGQCEESVRDQIVVAHDTPATLDARPNLLKLSESPASKEVMRLSTRSPISTWASGGT